MKILLDENLSKDLKPRLKDHLVSTVEDEGWRSIKNGDLLRLMIASGFEAFVTCDRHFSYQQNLRKFPISIIVLREKDLNYDKLLRFAPLVVKLLKGRLKPGPYELTLNP